MPDIRQIQLFNLEYNSWNGFMFKILQLELSGEKFSFESALLGLWIGSKSFIVSVCFIDFEISLPITF